MGDPVPPFQYVYAAVRANVTNRTSSPGTLGLLVPTWKNLLDVMGDTFQYTLDTPGHIVPRCSPTKEVRRTLDGSSYSVLFKEHTQARLRRSRAPNAVQRCLQYSSGVAIQ